MKLTGHSEVIGNEYCFVENSRDGKTIYTRQPLEEHQTEIEKATQVLYDLVNLSSNHFVDKYGGGHG